MLVTLLGMVTLVRLSHLLKAQLSMLVKVLPEKSRLIYLFDAFFNIVPRSPKLLSLKVTV